MLKPLCMGFFLKAFEVEMMKNYGKIRTSLRQGSKDKNGAECCGKECKDLGEVFSIGTNHC